MSQNVTYNGVTYAVPDPSNVNWGTDLTAFLVAIGTVGGLNAEMKQAVRVATTTPVTVSDTTDCVVLAKLAAAGAVAVALPAGTDGRWFVIADQTGDAATNNITITPNGAETINGSATYVINENRGSVVLVYSTTNTKWNVVARFTAGAVLANPMDSAGDMIYGGASGVVTKLDSGTAGLLLMANGAAAPTWSSTITGAKTFSNGIVFGGGGHNLNYYQEDAFTATFVQAGGFSAAVSIKWQIIGVWMFFSIPSFAATATAASTIVTGATDVPAGLRPQIDYRGTCSVINAGGVSNSMGSIDVLTTGQIIIGANIGGGNFTNSALAGLGQGGTTTQTFHYRIA